jgi:hypothetical protein
MNKTEKQKLDEIAKHLYAINMFIGNEYISGDKTPTKEELENLGDHIATCVRNMRNMLQ